MRSYLPTATHRGPADLIVESMRCMQLRLEMSPHDRILPDGAVRQDSWVIRELGVQTLDRADAHALAD